jgi:polyhydroxyalkanoate synthase
MDTSSVSGPSPGTGGALQALEQAAARLVQDFIAHLPEADRLGLSELFQSLAAQPEHIAQIQQRYYQRHLALWSSMLGPSGERDEQHAHGAEPPQAGQLAAEASNDRRFDAEEWETLPFFRLLKQSYLINSQWLRDLLEGAALEPTVKRRLSFVLRQCLDALAPTNFPATNPEAIKLALASRGATFAAGLAHLQEDLARGRIQMSDERAFQVGRNLAVTPGGVVFENAIAQLIQYTPRTAKVHARPLFIVPPFINKYYVLDLQPENSLVRFALDQGLQVFLVSWRNVPAALGDRTWDDYVRNGVLELLDATLEISGSKAVNALGFCVGGTLLATALAVMPRPSRVASLTLLATMLDFSDVGEIGVYVDEDYVRRTEREYAQGGVMQGGRLATAFASLRANELVWYFVINNYLMGRTPKRFDLLYWNGDSTNLPGRLYAWYLRNMYLENSLRVPGKLRLCGRDVDLGRIRIPAYVLATREDHIVPWKTAYASARLLAGTIEFVLGASGHIAGVVNPPAAARRHYWLGAQMPQDAELWFAGAQRRAGSWWMHWIQWLRPRGGQLVGAPAQLGSARHRLLEPAPGRYVRERPV